MKIISIPFVAGVLLRPSAAQASTAADDGFISGFIHPVLGVDHLLAMLCVGIISTQIGGRAIWSVPLSFVLVMLVGGSLGIVQIPLFSTELTISLSVFTLGIAIAADKKIPPMLAIVFVGFFALFHGHAHGSEIPDFANPLLYALGFVAGTASIHIAGVSIGLCANKFKKKQLLRYIGAVIAGIGTILIVQ